MSHPAAELLNRARQAHKKERFADAKRDLLAAVKICRESGPGKALAVALRQLGEAERRLGNPAGALRSYEEAVALMREDTEPLVLAHTIRHLGDVHQEQGRPEQARPCYEEALAIYRINEQSHPLHFANAIRAFAAHLHDADELQRSAPLWEEARNTYRLFGIHAGVAECSVRLARIARHQSDDEAADQQLAEARTAAEKSGGDELLAFVAKTMAEIGSPPPVVIVAALPGQELQHMTNLEILEADLNNSSHAEAVRQLLDEYARLPIGQGAPLAAQVLERLVPGLRRHPGTLVFLAWLDRRAVGVAVCMTGFATFTAKPVINIHDLAVTADCRGRGIGRLLLEAVESKARESGCGKVTLEVREDNAPARKLYRRFGFRDGGGDSATFFLAKTL